MHGSSLELCTSLPASRGPKKPDGLVFGRKFDGKSSGERRRGATPRLDHAQWDCRDEGRQRGNSRQISRTFGETFWSVAVFPHHLDPQEPGATEMNKTFGCTAIAIALVAITVPAEAKGCIKGALVGGAAWHFAGHHGLIGAAAGCAIGHHEANRPQNVQPTTTGSAPPPARK
jgi:hypothetical protein